MRQHLSGRRQAGRAWASALLTMTITFTAAATAAAQDAPGAAAGSNPIIRDRFTADPAPLVVGDTLYLYVGHDEAQRDEMFNMREWLGDATADMKNPDAAPP